jgi:hypothetical protein
MRNPLTALAPDASRRATLRLLAACPVMAGTAAIALAAPATAQAQADATAAGVTYLSAGRVTAIVAALLGLLGVVVAGWSLAHREQRRGEQVHRPGLMALSVGALAVVLGVVVVASADGGLGTGSGLGGGLVAALIGVVAMVLGGLVVRRHSRTAQRTDGQG